MLLKFGLSGEDLPAVNIINLIITENSGLIGHGLYIDVVVSILSFHGNKCR